MLRCFEPQHGAAAAVFVRQADIVERIVGEGKAAMAIDASCLAGEEPESGDFVSRERLLITLDPAIEAGRRGYKVRS